jgi:thiamine biosynthesis lipoprotein
VADAAAGPLLESYGGPGSRLERFETPGMGTLNVLLLGGVSPAAARRGAQEAFDILARLEQALSRFLPASDVALLNALGGTRPVRVGRDLLEVLALARQGWALTGGAFDPTVGPLLDAWGFTGAEPRVPPAGEVERLAALCGMDRVIIDEVAGTVRFDRNGASIDLGGIGKGYAVDAMAGRLRALGIPIGAVIAGRSSIAAWGAPPGEERWRFEVVHPEVEGEALAEIVAAPGAVTSSGAYGRRFFRAGVEHGHLLDPRTGRPARGAKSVTVWTETAALGEILSTALFVMGSAALPWLQALRGEGRASPRVSALLALEDPGAWGGIRVETVHVGEPGFAAAGPG